MAKNVIKGGDRILDKKDYSKWFFGLSSILALSTVWVVWDEFGTRRTYHDFQAELQQYELSRFEQDLATAESQFDEAGLGDQVADLDDQIAAAREAMSGTDYSALVESRDHHRKLYEYWDGEFKKLKSFQDAVFFEWKHAIQERNELSHPEMKHGGHGAAAPVEDHGDEAEDHNDGAEEHHDVDPAAEAAWQAKADKKEAEYNDMAARLVELDGKRTAQEQEQMKFQAQLDEFDRAVTDLEDKKKQVELQVSELKKRIAVIKKRDTREIKQVVNPELGLGGEYTFGTVDRCESCHVNTDKSGWDKTPELLDGSTMEPELRTVFTTHPRRGELLGAHSKDTYGCTVCHQGDGRATRFMPDNAFIPWSADEHNAFVPDKDLPHGMHHLWPQTMFRGHEVEASCHKCHSAERWISYKNAPYNYNDGTGAGYKLDDESGRMVADTASPMYDKGKGLFIEKGCGGCHLVKGYEELPRVGPALTRVRHKVRPEWLLEWVINPKAFREDTRMPQFFYPPADGEVERPEVDPARQREVATWIAAYVWQNARPAEPQPFGAYPGGGDPVRGREVVKTVGCLACHQVDDGTGGRLGVLNASRLEDVGAKVASVDWIWNWIQDPTWHNEYTRMPDLRLTRGEARDVTAYLWQSNSEAPAVDLEVRRQLEDPKLAKKGEDLMNLVGCPACHVLDGQKGAGRIAPELTVFGEKGVDVLAFGDSTIARTWDAWAAGKLKDPRQYIDERSVGRMPNFHLKDDEVEALVVFLRALRRPLVPEHMKKDFSGGVDSDIAKGQMLVEHLNCVGCHQIEGRGGDILFQVVDNMSDEVQSSGALTPPNLKGEGVKIQADYLNKFLRNPTPIRPWVKTRMPTFNLDDDQVSGIIAYFRSLEGIENPYDSLELTGVSPESISRGRKLFETYQCRNCHLWQGALPAGDLGPRNGPDLAVLNQRMRPEGVAAWIRDPQRMMPGTAMPGFFFNPNAQCEMLVPNTFGGDCLTDEAALKTAVDATEEQINDIVNYLFAGPHAKRWASR